ARPFSVIPPGDFPIPFETRLRSALRSSTWRMSRRRSASRSTISLTRWAPPLSASARSTASGCSRINLRSSKDETLDGFGGGDGLGFDPRDRAHAVVGVEIDDPHAHRVAALRGHLVGVDADHLALGGDDEEVVAAPDLDHADHRAVAAGGLDVDDPLAGPALQPVLLERRALAEAALGDGEDLRALLHDVGADHLIVVLHLDAAHAGGAAAHRPDLFLGEADGHAELGGDHHFTVAVGTARRHQLIAILQADGLDAARARVRVSFQLGLLHLALARHEEDVAAGVEVADRHAGGDVLPLAQREEIHHRLALGGPAPFGNLVDLEPVDLARVGEEQQ